MNKIEMPKFDVVLDPADPDFTEKLRDAIGAKPDEPIEIVTPQFERTTDMPPPPSLPQSDEDWKQLKSMSVDEAKERGFGNWDGGLFLFPGEWYHYIHNWLEVETINGEVLIWGAEKQDDDIRFGCLAYGVRLGPPTDGED